MCNFIGVLIRAIHSCAQLIFKNNGKNAGTHDIRNESFFLMLVQVVYQGLGIRPEESIYVE